MNFFKFVLFTAFLHASFALIGDHKPFCWAPDQFLTTLQPVKKQLDLQKYQGLWYEIIRAESIIESRFTCVESIYTYNPDAHNVNMEVKFHLRGGGIEDVHVNTEIKNEYDTYWKIAFNPLFVASYFVLDFDDNYEWALVGEPCRDYFWILSKNPKLNPVITQKLLYRAKELGFDISKLIKREDICPEGSSLM